MYTKTISIDNFLQNRFLNFSGMSFTALTAEELSARGLRYGVRVEAPLRGIFLSTNIRPGFIITSVDGLPLLSLAQLQKHLQTESGAMISGIYEDGTHDHYFIPSLS